MGEYADDAIERDWNLMVDEMEDGDIDDTSFRYNNITYTTFEFKSIKKETEKAWCLIMMGDAELWLPKSKCLINQNTVAVPNWLKNKIIQSSASKKTLNNLNMKQKSIDDFIKELQAISPDKRALPLVVDCPNGLEVYPSIKMRFKDNNFFDGTLEKMVITWQ